VTSYSLKNTLRTAAIVIAVACASFWARSIWEAGALYSAECVVAPAENCVENLRRAASWNSPLNWRAQMALKDLQSIAATDSQFKTLALEGSERAKASTRSIFDSHSLKLAHDLNPFAALASFLAFIGWISCLFLMIQKGFNENGSRNPAALRRYGLRAVLLFVVWILALSNA